MKMRSCCSSFFLFHQGGSKVPGKVGYLVLAYTDSTFYHSLFMSSGHEKFFQENQISQKQLILKLCQEKKVLESMSLFIFEAFC